MSSSPRYLIVGNWKMNKSPAETADLAAAIAEAVGEPPCGVVVCPTYVSLQRAVATLEGSPVAVGAQNCHWETSGAYTGEISPAVLKAMGVDYVILGHSERRTLFGESDAGVARRLKAALAAGLVPIVCIGETLDQRQSGVTERILDTQLTAALEGIAPEQVAGLVVAYEPVWAIGTGETATEAQAEAACAFIRSQLAAKYGDAVAGDVRILYGGSMNAANAAGLLSCDNIDGGLIGGAALKAGDFAAIVAAASEREQSHD